MALTTLTSGFAVNRGHETGDEPGHQANGDDDDADPDSCRHGSTGEPVHDEADRSDQQTHQSGQDQAGRDEGQTQSAQQGPGGAAREPPGQGPQQRKDNQENGDDGNDGRFAHASTVPHGGDICASWPWPRAWSAGKRVMAVS